MTDLPNPLHAGREIRIPVTGRSMLPTLIPGIDRVTIDTSKQRKPRIMDIALALESEPEGRGHFILHRIVGAADGVFVMMGDGNLQRKERINAENILGVVTEILRGNRIIIPSRVKGRLWWWLRPLRRIIVRLHPAFRKHTSRHAQSAT